MKQEGNVDAGMVVSKMEGIIMLGMEDSDDGNDNCISQK